jgi:EAL domain-containing protein (putative c-di-GMP-specific phosphodiesterase class I)
MPFSELKIDRSFVLTMVGNPRNSLIMQSVIALGHDLGLTIVAEGVETESALVALAGWGCDVAQGYHISRPVPINAFDTWSVGRHIMPLPYSREQLIENTAAMSAARNPAPRLAFGT